MPRHPEDAAAELLDTIELFAQPLTLLLQDESRSNLETLAALLERYDNPEAIDQLHQLFWAAQALVKETTT